MTRSSVSTISLRYIESFLCFIFRLTDVISSQVSHEPQRHKARVLVSHKKLLRCQKLRFSSSSDLNESRFISLRPFTISTRCFILQRKCLFWRYFLWPFSFRTYVLHRFVIPALTWNHSYPNLQSLPRFEIFFTLFEIPWAGPICNPTCRICNP